MIGVVRRAELQVAAGPLTPSRWHGHIVVVEGARQDSACRLRAAADLCDPGVVLRQPLAATSRATAATSRSRSGAVEQLPHRIRCAVRAGLRWHHRVDEYQDGCRADGGANRGQKGPGAGMADHRNRRLEITSGLNHPVGVILMRVCSGRHRGQIRQSDPRSAGCGKISKPSQRRWPNQRAVHKDKRRHHDTHRTPAQHHPTRPERRPPSVADAETARRSSKCRSAWLRKVLVPARDLAIGRGGV